MDFLKNQSQGEKDAFNLIKDLLPDDAIVEEDESGNKITVKNVRDMEKHYNVDPTKDTYKNVYVFWDDCMQFTTLGLIELMLDMEQFGIPEDDRTWDYGLYFYRTTEHTKRIIFVQHLFKTEWNIDLTLSFIEEMYILNYSKILSMSPMSTNFITLIKLEAVYRSLNIIFEYPIGTEDALKLDIKSHFTGAREFQITLTVKYDYGMITTDDVLKGSIAKGIDLIFGVDLDDYLVFAVEHEVLGISMVVPVGHNGVEPETLELFRQGFGRMLAGPMDSEITQYDEAIVQG